MPSGEEAKPPISSWILKAWLQSTMMQLVRKVKGCSKEKRALHNRVLVHHDPVFRPTHPSLPSHGTLLFILGPLFAQFFIFPVLYQLKAKHNHERKGVSVVQMQKIFSHLATKTHRILSVHKMKIYRAVSVPVTPLRAGPGNPAGIRGVFPSQKAAGNRQKSLLSVSLPSQGELCIFFI